MACHRPRRDPCDAYSDDGSGEQARQLPDQTQGVGAAGTVDRCRGFAPGKAEVDVQKGARQDKGGAGQDAGQEADGGHAEEIVLQAEWKDWRQAHQRDDFPALLPDGPIHGGEARSSARHRFDFAARGIACDQEREHDGDVRSHPDHRRPEPQAEQHACCQGECGARHKKRDRQAICQRIRDRCPDPQARDAHLERVHQVLHRQRGDKQAQRKEEASDGCPSDASAPLLAHFSCLPSVGLLGSG